MSLLPAEPFVVNSITLQMTNRAAYTLQDAGWTISAYAILAANKGWGETTTTWNERNTVGDTSWAGTAGLSTAGTDYDSTALSTWTVTALAANDKVNFAFTGWSSPALTSLLNGWIADGANNAGLVLRPKDVTTYSNRVTFRPIGESSPPVLLVDYTVVPEPGSLALLLMGGALLGMFRKRRSR